MNKVFLFGKLGNDPDLRMTSGGKAVLNLSVATSERYKDKSGEWKDSTEWHKVVCWTSAEWLAKNLKKGDNVTVMGKIRTESYEKDGEKRYATKIVADSVMPGYLKRAEKEDSGTSFDNDTTPFD